MKKAKTIAFLHGDFPCGGAENVTIEAGKDLHEAGYRVVVLCRKFHSELMPEDSPIEVATYHEKLKKKKSVDELETLILRFDIQVLIYVCIHPPYAAILRQRTGVHIVSANHNIPFWQAFGKKARKEQLSKGNLWQRLHWELYYRRRCQKLHVYDEICHEDYRHTLQEVDAYTVLCDAYREELIESLRLNTELSGKIHVIPNFQKPNAYPCLEKEKVVLFVGRLTYADKRVDRLLRIWALVEAKVPEWRLLIVGEGEDEIRLHRIAQELKLEHVCFEGRQNPQTYYDRASILCLTSTSEGWGLVLTEAQTNGVVPIAFDSSAGVHTLLAPSGTNGILIAPFDEEEYAHQLLQLMQDESWLKTLQGKVVQRKYPKTEMFRRLQDMLETLMN